MGASALLAEVGSVEGAVTLYAALRRAVDDGRLRAVDVVPAARTVLLDGVDDLAAARAVLVGLDVPSGAPAAGSPARPVVEVPTVYDGADLTEVARAWGMTTAEAVATHTGTELVVAFCGFAPGFAYCTGLPPELHLPRLADPRPRVPAGSVGVAGEFTGVYPTASPGGWRLLGRTDLVLWDTAAEPPATLAPGTRVRFREVSG